MNPTPDQPKTIDDSDMPDNCRKILKNAEDENGRLFLQHECSKNAKQKFWVFGTDENVQKLCRSDTMLSDGSFTKPKYFSQLMTIHARIEGKFVQPCLYVLLPKKKGRTKRMYKKVLKVIIKKVCKVGSLNHN